MSHYLLIQFVVMWSSNILLTYTVTNLTMFVLLLFSHVLLFYSVSIFSVRFITMCYMFNEVIVNIFKHLSEENN